MVVFMDQKTVFINTLERTKKIICEILEHRNKFNIKFIVSLTKYYKT